jgi:two-component system CheB/CheR fusion protein
VTASPLESSGTPGLFVVSFQQSEEPEALSSQDANEADAGPEEPPEEVRRLRDELRSAIEEMQASNEEHKAAAEEAMSVNEELQSSNEELETSKEEMQSLNEELSTVNSQLHAKMEELQGVTSDLRGLLASTDIAVIFLDAQFRIRRYTPAARKLLELIGSDIGRPLDDLAKKFVDPDLLDDAQSVLEHLRPSEREVRSNDGCWYARRVLPYRTAEDRIAGVVITFVDISDRKRAHDLAAHAGDAARDDLQAMTSLHTAAKLLASATDMKGVLEEILVAALELLSSNQGEVQLYDPVSQTLCLTAHRGVPRDTLTNWDTVSLADQTSAVARALRERSPVLIEDVAQLPPTPFRENWLAAGVRAAQCIPLLTRDGELLGVISVHFPQPHRTDERSLHISHLLARLGADTVERMRIEEERARMLRSEQLARRALDEASQMKDDFLATLSHELRTPLSAILLWGKILRNRAVSSEEADKGLAAIIDSANAQARLIEDLLDNSRAAAGKLDLELGEADLGQIVRSVIEQNAPAASGKNLHIESDLSPGVGTVIADAIRIRQVVWNLLANAVKFTPEGGHITVSLTRANDESCLVVADDGVGISPEFLPHVFDRFRQSEGAITRKHGGLGLGLAISKQLVELHGGTIRAESSGVGTGTTFTVTLPLPAARESSSPSASRSAVAAGSGTVSLDGKTVLLVEDDVQTQRALSVILRQAGANVTTAGSAADALESYEASRPHVLLSDIGLPDLDGYALLVHIRSLERERRWPEVPAIALSAYTREQDRKRSAEAGFSAHLAKPIDADELVLTLREAAVE